MTYLDVYVTVMTTATGLPEDDCRQMMATAIEVGLMPAMNLFEEHPDPWPVIYYLATTQGDMLRAWARGEGPVIEPPP